MKRDRLEARLYRDPDNHDLWIAWSAKLGWIRFPARRNGWVEREPLVHLDESRLQEVPLAHAFNTGLMEAFRA